MCAILFKKQVTPAAKYRVKETIMLLVKALVVSGILLAQPAVAAQAPQFGEFEDGSKLGWQCSGTMSGKVAIIFIDKAGNQYKAVVDCIKSTGKEKNV